MKLGFYVGQLGLRGTDNFVWDLAHYSETLQGHTCFVLTPYKQKLSEDVTPESQDRFRSRFFVIPVMPTEDLDTVCTRWHLDAVLITKWGVNDGLITRRTPCVVHAIFECTDPHGDEYMAISDYMARKSGRPCATLPFIVDLPPCTREDARKRFDVRPDAVVFGRIGGWNQFDISYVQAAVVTLAEKHPDWVFLFMNTKPFARNLPNIRHLPGCPDPLVRSALVNACDAMVHGRSDGETFGLACAEFALFGKPVITTPMGDRAHVEMLGPLGRVCSDQASCMAAMEAVASGDRPEGRSAYAGFSPARVTQIFQDAVARARSR